jgi:hypothetical protein
MARVPVEPNKLKRFRLWLLEMEDVYGVGSIKDIHHHVDLLIASLDRHIFESENPKKSQMTDVRAFIAIFSNCYRIMTDYEYNRKISSVDVKTIEVVTQELAKSNCGAEDYLRWFFDEFLPENEKMCPPTIGLACSKFSLSKFLYRYRDEIKKRDEKALLFTAERDLYNRAKVLFEKTNDSKIRIWTEQYRSGAITLDDLRNNIMAAEESAAGDSEAGNE